MQKIKDFLSGKKVYILMGFGALAAIAQFFSGVDLGVDALPPVDTLGDLVSQLWAFAAASGFRAALSKT
jgi:hypothetical protein